MVSSWDLLVNGSLMEASFHALNDPWSEATGTSYFIIGLFFIVFMALLFLMNKNITINFVVSIIFLALLWGYIDLFWRVIIIAILVLELGGIFYTYMSGLNK